METLGGALAIALGAAIGVCLDEIFCFTPSVSAALVRWFGR